MKTRVQLRRSANSFSELSAAVDAFETVDELYRLLSILGENDVLESIDFRRQLFKDYPGARVESFRLNSPPDITINAGSIWLAALFFVMNYSRVKGNVSEMMNDMGTFSDALIGYSKYEIDNIVMGAKLLNDRLERLGEEKTRTLRRKTVAAKRWLNAETIEKISKDK